MVLVLSTISVPLDTFLEGGSSRLYRRWVGVGSTASPPSTLSVCRAHALTAWLYSLSLVSTDYGKSFHDISHRINNTFMREEFGVSVGPGSSVSLAQLCVGVYLGLHVDTQGSVKCEVFSYFVVFSICVTMVHSLTCSERHPQKPNAKHLNLVWKLHFI